MGVQKAAKKMPTAVDGNPDNGLIYLVGVETGRADLEPLTVSSRMQVAGTSSVALSTTKGIWAHAKAVLPRKASCQCPKPANTNLSGGIPVILVESPNLCAPLAAGTNGWIGSFTKPGKYPSIRKLAAELPTTRRELHLITLKKRILSPLAQRFAECVREIAKSLTHRK
jgi:hypothetical protein